MVNFPTQILDYDSHSPALLNSFLPSDPSICSWETFSLLENSDHVVLVSTDFLSNAKGNVSFHCTTFDYSHAD